MDMTDILSFCSCGDPDEAMNFIKMMLQKVADKKIYDYEEECDEFQKGLYWHILYYLDDHNLIEHGISVRGCWLTEKGKKVLKQLKETNNG